MKDRPLWSVPLHADEVPENGRDVTCVADAAVRAEIAKVAGLVALPRLEAKFHIRRQGEDRLAVTGTVSATVEQTCVVTLDPLVNEISERVDLVFDATLKDLPPSREDDEEPSDTFDTLEPLVDGTIDLGVIATDFLLLGIDPYPRKPDAAFEPPASPPDESPFAALAALKKERPGKG